MQESSWGYVNPQLVKTEYLNEFPTYTEKIDLKNGQSSKRLDEETWLDIMQYKLLDENNKYFKTLKDRNGGFDYKYIVDKFNLVERRNKGEFDWVILSMVEPARASESFMVGSNTYFINNGYSNIEANCKNFPIIWANIQRRDSVLHSIGHMAEDVLNKVFSTEPSDYMYYENKMININSQKEYNKLNLWQKYVLSKYNSNTNFDGKDHYNVGTVHFTPNSEGHYNYLNATEVYSNWRDWRENYPNFKGIWEKTNKNAWMSENPANNQDYPIKDTCTSEDRLFQRWWFKNMPHIEGQTNDGYYNNWWKYITTLDFVEEIQPSVCSLITLNIGENDTKLSYTLIYRSGEVEKKEITGSNEYVKIEDPSIAVVTKDGVLLGKKVGKTKMSVYKDGKCTTFDIMVTNKKITDLKDTKISISNYTENMEVEYKRMGYGFGVEIIKGDKKLIQRK